MLVETCQLPIQAFCGRYPREDEFREPFLMEPARFGKPAGGLWTSSYHCMYDDGWIRFVQEDYTAHPGYAGAWLLHPKPCRVWVMDGMESHDVFHDQFGVITPMEKKIAERVYHQYGIGDRIPVRSIDWQMVMQVCDAVWLTAPWTVRMTREGTFYGWDCESTLWFKWLFDERVDRVTIRKSEYARLEEDVD